MSYTLAIGRITNEEARSMMTISLVALLLQGSDAQSGSVSTIQIVAGIGAVILVAIVIMRRKRASKKEQDEEF